MSVVSPPDPPEDSSPEHAEEESASASPSGADRARAVSKRAAWFARTILLPVLIGLGGAWVGMTIAGRHTVALGPFQVQLQGNFGRGDTVIRLPPFGSLTADTHHFIGQEQIAAMKQGAFLINTGRGALVDTDALIGALESGKLGGAALDVLEGGASDGRGMILSVGGGTSPGMPKANILAMLEALQEFNGSRGSYWRVQRMDSWPDCCGCWADPARPNLLHEKHREKRLT